MNVQCEVEKPEIYVLVLGSSSIEDQAVVIPDRVEYLSNLSTPVVTTNGKLYAHNVYIHVHFTDHMHHVMYTATLFTGYIP